MIWTARVNGLPVTVRAHADDQGLCTDLHVEAAPKGAPLPTMIGLTFDAISAGLRESKLGLARYGRTLRDRRDETGGAVEGDEHVGYASSVVDYVFRACEARGLR